MKPLIFSIFIVSYMQANAQHYERYYDYRWERCEPTQARFYTVLKKKDSLWEREDYFIHERSLQMQGSYTDTSCGIAQGKFFYYYPNKHLESVGNYKDGKKDSLWLDFYPNGMIEDSITYTMGNKTGTSYAWHSNGYFMDSAVWNSDGSGVEVSWFDNGNPSSGGRFSAGYKQNGRWKYFHKNGKMSALELYRDGILTEKQYYDEAGNPIYDTTNKDHAAQFPGGMKAWQKYLSNRLYFPAQYKFENADKAVVVVSAVIDEDGNVTDVEINTPLYPAFDDIALKVIKRSPKWEPQVQHNRRIKSRIIQAVYFTQE
jgi:antitoxin component YwqK of YwqJK toxin-antitoxin module